MKKFVVIDGNAILHRAWHALPPTLTTEDGTIVNAVYGFASILLKVLADLKPEYVAVAWDTAAKTFRAEKYAHYKATRVTKEQELYDQIAIIQDLMKKFHFPNLLLDGYEADDVIGTLVDLAKKIDDVETIIVTGDLDIFQLIDERTRVYKLRKGISETAFFDAAAVREQYGIEPKQIIDLKAIMGDPSDNIKGVKGIGEVGAKALIARFGTVEALYKAIDKKEAVEGIKPAQLKKLVDGKEDAFIAKELVTIDCCVPIKFKLEDAAFSHYKPADVLPAFQKLGFKSLITRLPRLLQEERGVPVASALGVYTHITTPKACDELAKILGKQKQFAFDTETTGVAVFQEEILGLSVSFKEGEAYYIRAEAFTDDLKDAFADQKIKKIAHAAKFDLEVLQQVGFTINNLIFDTKIAAYLLNPGNRNHGLKDQAFAEFGSRMTTLDDLLGTGRKTITMQALNEQNPEGLAQYAAADADFTFRLYPLLHKRLKEEELLPVLEEIELPLIPVLAAMEAHGVLVDVKHLQALSTELEISIKTMEEKIHGLAGGPFNIDSPLQLSQVLFERLKLPTKGIKKTKNGFSTAAPELEKLNRLHPIIALISEYREKAKLKNTYVDSLPLLVNPKTGRVHTSFNQTVAATGRLSSSDPNLQNIPVRTAEGNKIREAFIAPPGYKLVSADYSQIELRVIASLAGDTSMIKAFRAGDDIHRRTASEIQGVPFEQVTDEMRYAAKAINFGIIYGQGPFGLSQTANISLEEARTFIETYFTLHKPIHDYLERMKEEGRKLGYVKTLFGRKRYVPEINSTVAVVRAAAERVAINMPIQGTAADLLKFAMIDVHAAIAKRYKPDEIKMLLTVHDELIFEVRDDLVDEAAKLIDEIMENPAQLKIDVPIKVDTEVGQSWGKMEKRY
ncbi:MAG: DNA polymerase I [Parcubacteria group bacterium]|nr:DNA polymerase I [Parcubacteria group bacterium]